ncbi:hypothetical protein PUNSTDRAFT_67047, partial [Punctularia strigosozonata HHB-11173 SS5]|uniref:uncharacterized protein n=1 Tax=Punctularia strigosozonata (strain HHB-11173) TaxID=741275 RepID=UPI00044166BD
MSNVEEEDTAIATHPFVKKPSADLILRSSDGFNFYVHQCILAEASPFFSTMLSLPQPDAEVAPTGEKHPDDKNGSSRAIVDMSENAQTLELLLRACYPYEEPDLDGLDEVAAVLSAAVKYEMAAPIKMLRKRLSKHAPTVPTRVYAIAVRHRLEPEAREAARASLRFTLKQLALQDAQELSLIPALTYQRYIRFMLRCREEFSTLSTDLRWIQTGIP